MKKDIIAFIKVNLLCFNIFCHLHIFISLMVQITNKQPNVFMMLTENVINMIISGSEKLKWFVSYCELNVFTCNELHYMKVGSTNIKYGV